MLIIAFDLGTGGTKASIYNAEGACLGSHFEEYATLFPNSGWHEQRPEDWWQAIIKCSKALINSNVCDASEIRYLAISGQSMAVVPIDKEGNSLRESVPIWSDTRAKAQADRFFSEIDYEYWYSTTGNGFSRECYAAFKMMWYRENEPELYEKCHVVLGSKDYVNLKLTGKACTDYSYASGSGVYNLKRRSYEESFIKATGLRKSLFPEMIASHAVVGEILPQMADVLGLSKGLSVISGGVDNSCMALGAGNIKDGRVYLSLGSSAWIAVSSAEPVIDKVVKPFVFDHIVPNLYTSATSIFSAGNSLKWASGIISNYKACADAAGRSVYEIMCEDAATSPVGANGVTFNPSLAGAPAAYGNANVKGAFWGIQLHHSPADFSRAVLEGIAMDLCLMHRKIESICALEKEIVIVGGGSKSRFWMQMFADVFDRTFVKINTEQDAASLGAAALAAVSSGLWSDFNVIDEVIVRQESINPAPSQNLMYQNLTSSYERSIPLLSRISNIQETNK